MEKAIRKVYGWLVFLYGLLPPLVFLDQDRLHTLSLLFGDPRRANLAVCAVNDVAIATGIVLFKPPLNFVIGYGLVRGRPWSRLAVVATVMTLPLFLLDEHLWYGSLRMTPVLAATMAMSAALTMYYVHRPDVRASVGDSPPFRWKASSALLVAAIVLLAAVPTLTSLYLRSSLKSTLARRGFSQVSALSAPGHAPKGFRRVPLFGCSLAIPQGMRIASFPAGPDESGRWGAALKGPEGQLWVNVPVLLGSRPGEFPLIRTKGYELHKFLQTNDWHPFVLILFRGLLPDDAQTVSREIRGNGWRGFAQFASRPERISGRFTVFDDADRRSFEADFILPGRSPSVERTLDRMTGSMQFPDPEGPAQAKGHFEKGVSLLEAGKMPDAQFELAAAVYLEPGNEQFREKLKETRPATKDK